MDLIINYFNYSAILFLELALAETMVTQWLSNRWIVITEHGGPGLMQIKEWPLHTLQQEYVRV
ncbi:hypothetical protein GCM10008018_37030 [Paenibacillus marchantiophytorum]|uniref:Uncharacterized protein n=1 Tax=Paenibacillus marchantiophytorum TaxID=1619310 RepID=A0ABQ1EUL3_9BACL|nr:hypothetical protein [Paenibacillus marchantiophytorum]GFZ87368.1 hypothetical protein GCM10008018_37030 [Paenibacillus marchantiophytorum]